MVNIVICVEIVATSKCLLVTHSVEVKKVFIPPENQRAAKESGHAVGQESPRMQKADLEVQFVNTGG